MSGEKTKKIILFCREGAEVSWKSKSVLVLILRPHDKCETRDYGQGRSLVGSVMVSEVESYKSEEPSMDTTHVVLIVAGRARSSLVIEA